MKTQILPNTLTADPDAFGVYETFKRNNEPFLIDEYFITRTRLDDYETRVSVLDEDQNPIVTAVVEDVYANMEAAEHELAFVGAIASQFRFGPRLSDAQLLSLKNNYELFLVNATFPSERYPDFQDLILVKKLIGHVQRGGSVEEFFTPPVHTRKNVRTDYSIHPFREVATTIAKDFVAASAG